MRPLLATTITATACRSRQIGTALTDLTAPLSLDQQTLIETMADAFLKDGEWPVWDYVRRTLYLKQIDATKILKSLPKVGGQETFGLTYGLAWYDPTRVADDACPALTIAAGLHVPNFAAAVSNPFLLVLKTMIEMERNAPISTKKVTEVRVTPEDVRRARPSISDHFMGWLPDLLAHEPPTYGGGYWAGPDGSDWSRGIRRTILEYERVRDLRSYVERVTELTPEPTPQQGLHTTAGFPRHSFLLTPPPTAAPDSATARRVEYVDESLLKELEEKAGTATLKVDKLLGLIRELNTNFAEEHPYACHALLRAIIDHVPPIFGPESFEQLASNRHWPTPVDKTYMGNLSKFKTQGHDVLHRRISKEANLLSMHDVPPPIWLNTLLRECIKEL